ncbi:MAG: hemin-degrading factor [Bacteroidetes bacterium 47-18]|nr:MAG: hemin-degrading factor [Bacteroidetes bacterium 47-18]
MTTNILSLKEQYAQMKSENPKMRIREIAKQLQSSEAQLLATGVGENVTRLKDDPKAILGDIIKLGKVMALTRNDHAVHERKGVYDNLTFQGPVGTFVNEDIDLRLFMMAWAYAFAVNENDRLSIQFFDKSGEAVHKIYLTEDSDREAYHQLVEKFRAEDQSAGLAVTPYPAPEPELKDEDVDAAAFREEWMALQDTHDFFGLLQKHKVTRTQALRLAPEGMARQLDNDVTRKVFNLAVERQVPIMVFIGNRGCIQIHTGEVYKLMDAGPWFNVLDPDFNMHLNETRIASSWLVVKPSRDGLIHAIEVYDAAGELIVQLFGKRKPGIPELESWRAIVKEVSGQ